MSQSVKRPPEGWTAGVRFPAEADMLFVPPLCLDRLWARLAFFSEGIKQPEREANHLKIYLVLIISILILSSDYAEVPQVVSAHEVFQSQF
jgi:hypothetical protein